MNCRDRFAWQAQEVAVETSFEHQSSIAEASMGVKCVELAYSTLMNIKFSVKYGM